MKVIGIIQARMGSTRLPGKMLLPIQGKPIIEHVVERARLAHTLSDLWLATTSSPADDVLAEWATLHGIRCYRGSEKDVLDRYYQTARVAQAEAIVRITGDCPLHDWEVIDQVVSVFQHGAFDYVCNAMPPTFPDGLDVEVFSFRSLERAWQSAKLTSEREHVTPYIWKHPERFKIQNVLRSPDLSSLRLTLDTKEDYSLITLVFEELARSQRYGHLAEVVTILDEHPDWLDINGQHQRNEGYQKSIQADTKEVTSLVRRALPSDSRAVWKIRFDAAVAATALTKEIPSFESHDTWFQKSYFTGLNNYCWVIVSNQVIGGYCRCDANAYGGYTVSIGLDQNWHGLGFGKKLLFEALLELPAGTKLRAEIKTGNEVSLNLFKAQGFMESEEQTDAVVLTYTV